MKEERIMKKQKKNYSIKEQDTNNIRDMFQYLVDKKEIDLEELQKQYELRRRKELLEQHQYSIWQGPDGNWRTYVLDENDKRKLVKLKSKADLENRVIEFQRTRCSKFTVCQVYEEWISFKVNEDGLSKATHDRYETDFIRFFPNSKLAEIPIRDVREDDLEFFVRQAILKHELTKKSYSNLKTILTGIFKWAKKQGYTTISISHFLNDLQLSEKMFRIVVKKREKEIFEEDELPRIADYIYQHMDIWGLACLLSFETGLRVGELSTLKKSDIDLDKGEIFVQRTETYYKDESGIKQVHIKDNAKTIAGNRVVILPPTAPKTIRHILELNPNGEYLFEYNGQRIRGCAISKKLTRICKALNIVPKTIHKARKTYGTSLIDNGVDESIVAEQMGHTDISTTKQYYYYSNKNRDKKREQIARAIAI